MVLKQCARCKISRELEEFYISFKRRIVGRCKECRNKTAMNYHRKNRKDILVKMLAYRTKNREKIRDQRRRHYLIPENKKRITEKAILWVKNNPIKYKILREKHAFKAKARQILSNSIMTNKIKKQPCRNCGNQKVHGHHPDYTKPLDVIWLWSACHSAVHRNIIPLHQMIITSNF